MDAAARARSSNLDEATVAGFGDEWSRFDQASLDHRELELLFDTYFRIFDWESLPPSPHGFDLGCGSGRWARLVAPRVGILHCIDASPVALGVARRNLTGIGNCRFHHASASQMPLPDASMDFGYSLGVLHHVPDTADALAACVAKLKPGAPFLLYLYYAFDNRPLWYRAIWRASDLLRRGISRLPTLPRTLIAEGIATLIYWPLARLASLLESAGRDVSSLPLAFYRDRSFYTMRTDALDRFGTRLEQRFTRNEIRQMMELAGLRDIRFSDRPPFWCAIGRRVGSREAFETHGNPGPHER